MLDQGPREEPETEKPSEERRGPSPMTLLVATALVVGLGYFLVVKLGEMRRVQDCVISGRRDCEPVSGGK
jgi:hypothetical protein